MNSFISKIILNCQEGILDEIAREYRKNYTGTDMKGTNYIFTDIYTDTLHSGRTGVRPYFLAGTAIRLNINTAISFATL